MTKRDSLTELKERLKAINEQIERKKFTKKIIKDLITEKEKEISNKKTK